MNLKVQETDVTIEELLDADEIFCTGTAVVVTSVGNVSFQGKDHMIGIAGERTIAEQLKKIYPTNWELSAARASNVVNYLIKKSVNSGRLQASGYADRWPAGVTWYDVRSGEVNDSIIKEQNRTQAQMQKNRRIKIVFTNN